MRGFPTAFGKYVLLRPLARGGMGQIYLAAAGELGGFEKLCVVKKVLPEKGDSAARRFLDEAKVVVRLNHANLVQVFDAGMVDGEGYLAMELCEGKDLRAVWNRCAASRARIPVDVALYVVREVCRGLAYAHSYGELALVHRDVSPPNILVSYHGDVKLTDFGLARSTLKQEKTAPGFVLGRFSYLAPEQARGEDADVRTDLYSVGIILWELLTGSQLFPSAGLDPADALNRLRAPAIEAPSTRAPRLPPELDALVMKALSPERATRHASADELRRAVSSQLAALAPTADSDRVASWMRGLFAEEIAAEHVDHERLLREELPKLRERTAGEAERAAAAAEARAASPSPAAARRRTAPLFAGPMGAGPMGAGPTGAGPMGAGPMGAGPMGAGPMGAGPAVAAAATAETPPAGVLAPGPRPATALIGAVLDGRYRIEALIGEGGMGRVYEAEHVEIGKKMAVKVLHPAYGHDADAVARFRREARAASTIGHPNIVDVTDSGATADGSVFFVMERLEGIDLADLLHRERRVAWPRAVAISIQMCRALAAAHQAGIVHRDLKPENVYLVTRDAQADFVKILDFGIAKVGLGEAVRLTNPGIAMGTPEYMAPEQAAGKAIDARVDVYALGAILYEMVVGEPPFPGDNIMEVLTRKATEAVRSPRAKVPELPEPLERVILAALERDPERRPQTMARLEYELAKLVRGRAQAIGGILGLPAAPEGMGGTDAPVVAAAASPGLGAAQAPGSAPLADGRAEPVDGGAGGLWDAPRAEATAAVPPGEAPWETAPRASGPRRAVADPAVDPVGPTLPLGEVVRELEREREVADRGADGEASTRPLGTSSGERPAAPGGAWSLPSPSADAGGSGWSLGGPASAAGASVASVRPRRRGLWALLLVGAGMGAGYAYVSVDAGAWSRLRSRLAALIGGTAEQPDGGVALHDGGPSGPSPPRGVRPGRRRGARGLPERGKDERKERRAPVDRKVPPAEGGATSPRGMGAAGAPAAPDGGSAPVVTRVVPADPADDPAAIAAAAAAARARRIEQEREAAVVRALKQAAAQRPRDAERAERTLREALVAAPDEPRLRSALADLLGERAEALAAARKLRAAVELAAEAVALDGGRIEARLRLAELLLKLGRGAQAADQYARVLEARPKLRSAQLGLAQARKLARRRDR